MSERSTFAMVGVTGFIAIVLTMIPLPFWLDIVRPAFLVLVVLYWCTMAPYTSGIALAFFPGLLLDVVQNSLLGEHALAMSLVGYLALRFHLMVRAKPLFEQCLFVFAALLIYELVLWTIDGWSDRGAVSNATRWVHTATGALLWPLLVGVMGRLHAPQ
jgi:rod shape-determining protein MreD